MFGHLLAKCDERIGDLLERLRFFPERLPGFIGVVRASSVRVQKLHELVEVRALLRELVQRVLEGRDVDDVMWPVRLDTKSWSGSEPTSVNAAA